MSIPLLHKCLLWHLPSICQTAPFLTLTLIPTPSLFSPCCSYPVAHPCIDCNGKGTFCSQNPLPNRYLFFATSSTFTNPTGFISFFIENKVFCCNWTWNVLASVFECLVVMIRINVSFIQIFSIMLTFYNATHFRYMKPLLINNSLWGLHKVIILDTFLFFQI